MERPFSLTPVSLIDEWEAAEAKHGGVLLTLKSMGAQIRVFLPPGVAGPLSASIRMAAENAMRLRSEGGDVLEFRSPSDPRSD